MIGKVIIGMVLLAEGWALHLNAQLAITEVMSETDTVIESGLEVKFKGPDYWELTNFGTNDLSLDGYSFSDSRQTNLLVAYPFTNLVIHPAESIIFFRLQPGYWVTNDAEFKAWWGEENLPLDLQTRTFLSPGLDGDYGDELWLYDAQLNVVDMVRFGQARPGRSFVYEPGSGVFGVLSILGAQGAVQALPSDDVGSPGATTGPSPLRFVEQPADLTVDAGASATFTAAAVGLPRPKYQWLANYTAIPRATTASLILPSVEPTDAGNYRVQISNGLVTITSNPALLIVNTNPTAPMIVSPPSDMTVFPGQTAVFTVKARGYPLPWYQWQANGADIAGATNPTLVLQYCSLPMNGIQYTVRVSNPLDEASASAMLSVVPRPCLRFTEIMAEPEYEDSSGHYDWFELTNCSTNEVDLMGYRLFDTPTFIGAHTITEPVVVQPGESVVFVERMTPENFTSWWGQDRLPATLQILTYHRFSLSSSGEALFLWNAAARDPFDTVATVSWAGVTTGVSLECANYCEECEVYGCIGECLIDSVFGEGGAVRAVDCNDLGSPGSTSNPPPRFLSIQQIGDEVFFKCRVNPGRNYRLSGTTLMGVEPWFDMGTFGATDCLLFLSDEGASAGSTRFYRLEELP